MISRRSHVSQATKSTVESPLTTAVSMADQTLTSADRLSDLNINLARATLVQSNIAVRQLIAAENMHEFLSLWSAQIQPNARRTFDYGYYLTTILASAQAELIRIAGMSVADNNRKIISLVGNAGKSLPAVLEATRELLSSVMDGADTGCARRHQRDSPPATTSIHIASEKCASCSIPIAVERPVSAQAINLVKKA